MYRSLTLVLCLVVVTAGCTTSGGTATDDAASTTESAGTPTDGSTAGLTDAPTSGSGPSTSASETSPSDGSHTATVTGAVTPTAGPARRPETLPSIDACSGNALPAPNATDGPAPATYPDPPATVSAATVANYTAAFERAYFRNAVIAEEAADPDSNLTALRVYAEPGNVTRVGDGYVVTLGVLGSTLYESGTHGDRMPTVGYFVNETVLVRATVESHDAPVTTDSGTTLLHCE